MSDIDEPNVEGHVPIRDDDNDKVDESEDWEDFDDEEEEEEEVEEFEEEESDEEDDNTAPVPAPPPKTTAVAQASITATTTTTTLDPASPVCFLFDVANVSVTLKRELAIPVSEFAAHLPALLQSLANKENGSGAFRRAVAVDGVIDRHDEARNVARTLRKSFRDANVEMIEYHNKGQFSAESQVQRAVDVALAVQLLELADALRPLAVAAAAASSSSAAAERRHVFIFSADSDLEPAVEMALARNPMLRITVVSSIRGMSKRYVDFLRRPGHYGRVELRELSDVLSAVVPISSAASSVTEMQQGSARATAAEAAASPAMSAPSSPFNVKKIVECRRESYRTAAEWLVELFSQLRSTVSATSSFSSPSSPPAADIVLKINNDRYLLDQDLFALREALAAVSKSGDSQMQAALGRVCQLWYDHTELRLVHPDSARCFIDIFSAMGQLAEVHASHTNTSPALFNAVAKHVINRTNRTLYLNVNTTPCSEAVDACCAGLLRSDNGSNKTVKLRGSSGRGGQINARFVGTFQQRVEQRNNTSSNNNNYRGRGGRGQGDTRGRGGRGGSGQGDTRGRGGRGGSGESRGRGRAFYTNSKIDVPSDEDFTIDEFIAEAQQRADRGGGRGGRARGRGRENTNNMEGDANDNNLNNNNDDDDDNPMIYKGRGGSRGGDRGGRGGDRGNGNSSNNSSDRRRDFLCFSCGSSEHIARNCPGARQFGPASERRRGGGGRGRGKTRGRGGSE